MTESQDRDEYLDAQLRAEGDMSENTEYQRKIEWRQEAEEQRERAERAERERDEARAEAEELRLTAQHEREADELEGR